MPSVSDSISISESLSIVKVGSGVHVIINGVLVTKLIERNSLSVENIITRQVDRCKFTVRKYGSDHTYIPAIGRDVIIYNNGTKIFGGVITKVTQRAEDYKIILFDVECEDYTRLIDRKLVADTFSNQTIADIISSITANYLTGFSVSGVVGADRVVSYVAFNYIPASQCFQQLADLIQYDWYVDYDKIIHFFNADTTQAPFDLSDDDGSYIFSSLRIRRDNSQLKNVIYIRGGEYLASTFTTEYVSNGVQNVYALPYRYDDIQTSVSSQVWSKGRDGIDPIALYDYMWNNDEKFIRFRGDRIPSDTTAIRVAGRPYLPVRVVVRDEASINSVSSAEGGSGEYEYLIIDNSIDSREGARERGNAELEAYKETLSEGEFRTYEDGLRAGQTITVNSLAHGINEDFLINKVVARMRTHDTMEYQISLVTTKTFGIIEFLQGLLLRDRQQIIINPNEVIDLVYSKSENISISETVTASLTHNPQSESMTISESVTEQSLNYWVHFVVGDYPTPSGTKRQFILNYSPLGEGFTPTITDRLDVRESVSISVS